MADNLTVGLAQIAPVWLNREKTISKCAKRTFPGRFPIVIKSQQTVMLDLIRYPVLSLDSGVRQIDMIPRL